MDEQRSSWRIYKRRSKRSDQATNLDRNNSPVNEDEMSIDNSLVSSGIDGLKSCRSSIKKVNSIMSKFNDVKKSMVKAIGFAGILEFPNINKVDRDLSAWLLYLVDCDKRTIEINNQNYPIRPIDVHNILGVPIRPLSVHGLDDDTPEDKLDFIRLVIGAHEDLPNALKSAEQNVTKEFDGPLSGLQSDQFKVSFIVFLVSQFLAPSKSEFGIKNFWGSLLDPSKISNFKWSAFVLDNIIEAARKLQNTLSLGNPVSSVDGCPLVLQVFYLDVINKRAQHNFWPRISFYAMENLRLPVPPLLRRFSRTVQNNERTETLGCSNVSSRSSGENSDAALSYGCRAMTPAEMLPHYLRSDAAKQIPPAMAEALRWHNARIIMHMQRAKLDIINEFLLLSKKLAGEIGLSQSTPNCPVATRSILKRSGSGYCSDSAASGHRRAPAIPTPRRVQFSSPTPARKKRHEINEGSQSLDRVNDMPIGRAINIQTSPSIPSNRSVSENNGQDIPEIQGSILVRRTLGQEPSACSFIERLNQAGTSQDQTKIRWSISNLFPVASTTRKTAVAIEVALIMVLQST